MKLFSKKPVEKGSKIFVFIYEPSDPNASSAGHLEKLKLPKWLIGKLSKLGTVYRTGLATSESAEFSFWASGVSKSTTHGTCPRSWKLKEKITVGETDKGPHEIEGIVDSMKNSYTSGTFDFVRRNANHFVLDLAKRLDPKAGLPAYVNRTAQLVEGDAELAREQAIDRSKVLDEASSVTNQGPFQPDYVAEKERELVDLLPLALSFSCLNEDPDHPLSSIVSLKKQKSKQKFVGISKAQQKFRRRNPPHLKSDADEQLIVSVQFADPVKVTHLFIDGHPDESFPRVLKLFVNRENLNFDDADQEKPALRIELEAPPNSKRRLPLNSPQLMAGNIRSVTLFVESNFGADETIITDFKLFGTLMDTMEMSKLKKQPGINV